MGCKAKFLHILQLEMKTKGPGASSSQEIEQDERQTSRPGVLVIM